MRSEPSLYDTIGQGYRRQRVPDPRIAARIRTALGNAATVCNVGAGAGAYEPEDLQVVAVEPSSTMIAQRTVPRRVIRGRAEVLPFDDGEFDASMAILTLHHWQDAPQGLSEMRRVSRRQVVLTFDVEWLDAFWLVRDYLPEITTLERRRAPRIAQIMSWLETTHIETVPIPWDCTDGFQAAYWRRPWAYLRDDVRGAISTFSQLPQSAVEKAMARLATDLRSGAWQTQYASLLDCEEIDLGYRLIVSGRHD